MHDPGRSRRRRLLLLLRWSLLLGSLPVIQACTDAPVGETGAPDPVDIPVVPVEDCEEGIGPEIDVMATLTEIPTVVRVTWRTPKVTDGVVYFQTATGKRHTAVSSGTEHTVLLVGNRARSDVAFRIVTDDGERLTCGEARTITTGALSPDLPNLDVTIDAAYAAEDGGYTVVPVITQLGSFVVLLDSEGQYVWAWEDTPGAYDGAYFNADVDLARGGILVNELAESDALPGAIRRVGFDGTVGAPVEIPGAHTDFVELPDGGMAALSWDIREVDGQRILGDRIVEVDAAGAARTVWSVWDDYAPDTERPWPTGYYVADPTVGDWSHVNAIAYDAVEDDYLVSIPFNGSVARIDRATGNLDWFLAGDDLIVMPHSVQPLGQTVLVFSRGDLSNPATCSEATEIDIDTHEVVWSYQSESCLLVPFLGAALRLPNGNTLVDWSSAGQLDEVSPSGDLLWRVSLDLGAAFGFADHLDSLYPSG